MEYNREVEIVATSDGLEIDSYVIIPREWIFAAHAQLEKNSSARSEDSVATPRSIPEPEP